jgi:hypothetical protein
MSDATRKPPRPSHPTSIPPDLPLELDPSWDDETVPGFVLDDPMSESVFDRVTAVPDLPAEQYAKQVMSEQPPDSSPPPVPEASAAASVPAASRAGPNAATARPGRNRRTRNPEPTGLELIDTSPPVPATSPGPSARNSSLEPRDPMLELDLDEVARSGPPPAVLMPSAPASGRAAGITEMKDRYAMGDFTGALVVAERLLEIDADDIDAERYAKNCRDVLTQMYTARLGALTQRVRVAVPGDQIRWLSLDHRAGFMLSLIDGSSTVEELLDISGMNRLDALRILFTLFDQRVVALSER